MSNAQAVEPLSAYVRRVNGDRGEVEFIAKQVEHLEDALWSAVEFLERVDSWKGSDPDELQELIETISLPPDGKSR